jgi:hypothetical protein
MEKRGIDENEQRKIDIKIRFLESLLKDDKGLTKEAGGSIKVDVSDWDTKYIYFSVKIEGDVRHILHYPLEEFLN